MANCLLAQRHEDACVKSVRTKKCTCSFEDRQALFCLGNCTKHPASSRTCTRPKCFYGPSPPPPLLSLRFPLPRCQFGQEPPDSSDFNASGPRSAIDGTPLPLDLLHKPLLLGQICLQLLHLLRQECLREEEGGRGVVMCSLLHHDDGHQRRHTTTRAGWSDQPPLRPGNLRQRCQPHPWWRLRLCPWGVVRLVSLHLLGSRARVLSPSGGVLLQLQPLIPRASAVVECSSHSHGDRLLLMPQHGTQSSPPTSLSSSSDGLPAGHHHDASDTKEIWALLREMACGGCWWLLVVNCWVLIVCCWLCAVGCVLLVVCCWLCAVGCVLLVVCLVCLVWLCGCWLLVVGVV